jgi:VIT1/CCC1 family predicted Fe2+/Mn2+ transporter
LFLQVPTFTAYSRPAHPPPNLEPRALEPAGVADSQRNDGDRISVNLPAVNAYPPPIPPDDYENHLGSSRQYMRDIILGVNDGLVSTFLLVAGVVGGGLTATQVLLTGVAGALAGMISMGLGEYLATKSQEEVFTAEMKLEARHLKEHREHERDELRHMFGEMGLEGDDLETVVHIIDKSDDTMMGVMAGLEFGVVDTEKRSPILAGIASAGLFLGGALPAVLPFAFIENTGTALLVAALLTGIGLLAVGATKTVMTKTSPVTSSLENLGIGFAGGVLSYIVGLGFESLMSS